MGRVGADSRPTDETARRERLLNCERAVVYVVVVRTCLLLGENIGICMCSCVRSRNLTLCEIKCQEMCSCEVLSDNSDICHSDSAGGDKTNGSRLTSNSIRSTSQPKPRYEHRESADQT